MAVERDQSWLETICALFLILVPTISTLFIKKRWILRYQRELLTCSLGTIFSIVFVDLLPDLIEDAAQAKHQGHHLSFSLSIFGGIAFAFIMNAMHDFMEDTQKQSQCKHEKSSDGDFNVNQIIQERAASISTSNVIANNIELQIQQQASDAKTTCNKQTEDEGVGRTQSRGNNPDTESSKSLPCTVKVFLAAIIIDFIIDGFIIACHGITISIALLPHEFVHVLGDIVFLVNFGVGKTRAVVIRLLCQLATPMTGIVVKLLRELYKEALDTMHTYGHAVIAGMFLYILFVDIFPMIEEGHLESHQHHPHLTPTRSKAESPKSPDRIERKRSESIQEAEVSSTNYAKITLPICFAVSFSVTGGIIYCKDYVEDAISGWF